MSTKTLSLDKPLYEYLLNISLREPDVLKELREETSHHKASNMQISPDQGQFMGLVARLMDARHYLEVGTFTGYSSISMALNMHKNSKVFCCDVSKDYTDIAKRYWEKANVIDQISLYLGPAAETLKKLLDDGFNDTFDIIFIDADKENYDLYYELGLDLVRKGGLILIDNVLWNGAVADPSTNDADTNAIRSVNAKILSDTRIHLSVIPVGDGLTLAQRKL
ncbi:MAG: putative O-methyltransferase [Alphaproteobacteria bacterium MarineAlpha3_Bin5]|nr:SAM-dependent methyltransferase [Magnetovibrio sp.]PPR78733.1 MAG: putative O-methyltransferase [Alphaproteobacteria bacterium MarineAlpha3_Bin5]